jgi:hypothetical protein
MGKWRTLLVASSAPSSPAVAAITRSGVLIPEWLRFHCLPSSPARRATDSSNAQSKLPSSRSVGERSRPRTRRRISTRVISEQVGISANSSA